jgi:hypothetical protein
MPRRRSTSSRHCFMSLEEAMELVGWRNNSLAADSTPGTALDACVGVCCHAECNAAAAPSAGRLVACGAEEAASSSSMKSSGMKSLSSTIWNMAPSMKTSRNFKPSPLPGAPNVREEILRPSGGVHPP